MLTLFFYAAQLISFKNSIAKSTHRWKDVHTKSSPFFASLQFHIGHLCNQAVFFDPESKKCRIGFSPSDKL
jgi:hypothetical protein